MSLQNDTGMLQTTSLLRWRNVACAIGLFVLYYAWKVVYRLHLSPLSHVPGRKLAAASNLYAFYHDTVRGGQYIWEVEEMHKQFGPIVRISPVEVHVNDPEFIDQVFAGSGKRREKGQLTLNGLGATPTAIGTRDHSLHRSRRAALNTFFSAAKIRRLGPMIHEVLDQIFQRLDQHRRADMPVNFNLLYRAATHDLIADYAFGQGSVCFSRSDLNQPYFDSYHHMVMNWHFGTYFPSVGRVFRRLPPSVVKKVMPTALPFINLIGLAIEKINRIRSTAAVSEETTIFHGLLQSNLPESEKTSDRLAEEAVVLLSAGTDSSANTLSAITYHLLADPSKLQRLRAELKVAVPEGRLPTFAQVETLPYLSAVIQEGLRLHPAVSSRQQRVAPDEDLLYTNRSTSTTYKIPAGTCISMTPVLLSRLPDIYPSPNEFRPERFLENPKLKQYQLTFSRGTRMCLGINLAYQEMYIILAGLFGKFDVWDGTGEQNSLTLELFKTTREDVDIVRDLVTENVKNDSLGVRVMVKGP
ncbi:putative P450 monooxygenase [Cadophora sp. DSE1049]|nr:putative P450 monooxygenase [Cadophora sp. DSE1049]